MDISTTVNTTDIAVNTTEPTVGKPDCYFEMFVSRAVLITLLVIFGLCGNTISFYIFGKITDEAVVSFMLRALAVFDNVMLIGIFLLNMQRWISYFDGKNGNVKHYYDHQIYPYVKKYTKPILTFGYTGGIWMVVLIAIHRYVAVCRPLTASKFGTIQRARIHVLILTILITAYSIPRVLERDVVCKEYYKPDLNVPTTLVNTAELFTPVPPNLESGHVADNKFTMSTLPTVQDSNPYEKNKTTEKTNPGKCKLYLTKRSKIRVESTLFNILYRNVAFWIFSVLPCLVLIVLTIRLIITMHHVRKRRARLMKHNGTDASGHMTLMLVIVMIIQIATHGCALINRLVLALVSHTGCGSSWFFLQHIVDQMGTLNSSINFVIYMTFRRKFRKTLLRILCPDRQVSQMEKSTAMYSLTQQQPSCIEMDTVKSKSTKDNGDAYMKDSEKDLENHNETPETQRLKCDESDTGGDKSDS